MISWRYVKKYCSEDPSLIENYDIAVADDNVTWECHHRAEILPCGTYSQMDLRKFGLFKKRPACELIFLTPEEHMSIHSSNRKESTLKKMSTSMTGRKTNRVHVGPVGFHHTEETRRLMSDSRRGIYPEGLKTSNDGKKTPIHAFKDGVLEGTFESQNEAARKLGLDQGNIRKALKGDIRQTGGYTFAYAS